jgi:peptidyl-prolyl cis-trans isomerase B (cyclophilin B)
MKTLQDFEKPTVKTATIKTAKGEIVIELFTEKAPLTVANFADLVKKDFYTGIKFHRIIPGFMAQVGDPLSKGEDESLWGTGGPGYVIADEFGEGLKHDQAGILSMANRGPNTGGSQFFITHDETPWLDGKHAVFGKVTKGMDVVQSLEIGDEIQRISVQ